MITKHLIISQDENDFEVYLNADGEMFFSLKDNSNPTFFTLSFDEWQEVKKYIDKSFKDGGVNG